MKIVSFRKFLLKALHPILHRLWKLYSRFPSTYTYKNIKVKVLPGVFHPGLFFSTKLLIDFLDGIHLKDKTVLELGAGAGLISMLCAKRGAFVTASDISEMAVKGLRLNAEINDCKIDVVQSDLFEQLEVKDFEIIIINPPYYPKDPGNIDEYAWFCGEHFEYFQRLFEDLSDMKTNQEVYMVLSEDCDITRICTISNKFGLKMKELKRRKVGGEENYIFSVDTKERH